MADHKPHAEQHIADVKTDPPNAAGAAPSTPPAAFSTNGDDSARDPGQPGMVAEPDAPVASIFLQELQEVRMELSNILRSTTALNYLLALAICALTYYVVRKGNS